MRRSVWIVAAALGAAGIGWWYLSIYGWKPVGNDESGVSFQFAGCDDWPSDTPLETAVEAVPAASGVLYRVTDPAACGYSVRQPAYQVIGDTLRLSYELYTPNGELAACLCRYRSEFRFDRDPDVAKVTFSASGGG